MLINLLSSPMGRLGAILLLALLAGLAASPLLGLPDAAAQDLAQKLQPPSAQHWLGTDQLGRDVVARLLEGTLRSFLAAVLVLLGSMTISIAVGVLAANSPTRLDNAIMRVVDVLLAIPSLILALAIVGLLGPGFGHLLIALVISSWAGNARLARAYAQRVSRRPFVVAARLMGIGRARILFTHVVPAVIPDLVVVASLDLGATIVRLAGLAFLGLGPQPPAAELGAMLGESRAYLAIAPWLVVGPAVAIGWLTLGANLCGEALGDRSRQAAL